MPPVVDRAVGELVRRVQADLRPGAGRVDGEPDLGVLELVAEAVRPRLLVVAGPPPEPRRDRLVAHPVVDQHVGGRVRGLDAVRRQPLDPGGAYGGQGARGRLGAAAAVEEARGLVGRGADGQGVGEHAPLAGGELDPGTQRGDGVAVPAELARPGGPPERRRCRQGSVAPEERGLVALGGLDRGAAREGGDVGEAGVPVPPPLRRHLPHVVRGEHRAARGVEPRLEEQLVELAPRRRGDAAVPLEEGDEVETAGRVAAVVELDEPVLDGLGGVREERPVRPDAAVLGLERRVAEAVPAGEGVVGRPGRGGGERPRATVVGVGEVEELARAVLGEVLHPAGDHRELRVVDEGEAAAGLADGEAEALVGDDVRPRAGRPGVGDDVLAPVGGEVAVGVARER